MTVVILLASLSFQIACRKTAETKTAEMRIVEIDAQLNNTLPTGRMEDADKRSLLKLERAQLVKDSAPQVQPAQVPTKYSQPTVPAARAISDSIVIARDSRLQEVTPKVSTSSQQLSHINSGGLYATPSRRSWNANVQGFGTAPHP
jgi:hypothetical protein